VTTPIAVKEIVIKDPSTNLPITGITFLKDVTIEIPYLEADIPSGVEEANLRAFRYDPVNQRWNLVEGTQTVDTVNNIIKVVGVTTFSIFGIFPINASSDFETVKVFPQPYKPATAFGGTVKFINLPLKTTVRIFTVDGHVVRTLTTESVGDAGWVTWDGTNETGEVVVSGMYFYVMTADGPGTKRGKLVLLR